MANKNHYAEKLNSTGENMTVEEYGLHILYEAYLAGWRAYANGVSNPKDNFLDFLTNGFFKFTDHQKPSEDDIRSMMNEILSEEAK